MEAGEWKMGIVTHMTDKELSQVCKINPGEGNGNPLQYPCLENPTDGGAW